MILIDTPGIASLSEDTSARTTRFLTPEEAPSSADAVVYLMRHLHASDVKFLEAFRDTAAGAAQTVCAVGVLSRSDEIGSGRIDSLLSAGKVARRYERDGDLASLVLGVVPVAGLRRRGRPHAARERVRARSASSPVSSAPIARRLLVSADRFTRDSDATSLSTPSASALLGRFGIFGVRLATALIRGGVDSSTELAEAMVQQSGLIELQQFVRNQFRTRATTLKVRGVLLDPREARPRERPATAPTRSARASSGSRRPRTRCANSRCSPARASEGLPLTDQDAADAQLIIGGKGTPAIVRLGLARGRRRETCARARGDEARALAEARRVAAHRAGGGGSLPGGDPQPRRDRVGDHSPVGDRAPGQMSPPPMTPSCPRRTSCCRADQVMALGRVLESRARSTSPACAARRKTKRLAAVADRHPLH